MGVHTGDSVTVAPAMTLTDREYQRMRDLGIATHRPCAQRRRRFSPAGLSYHRQAGRTHMTL